MAAFRTELKGNTKHISPENYPREMKEYEEKTSKVPQGSLAFIDIPIIYKEIKNARGQCFYLNAKDKLATLEPQLLGII